ncbi:hypothetical protein [Phascolarctobacterium sp.]
MAYSKRSGNFLPKQDIDQAEYQHNKQYIKMGLQMILTFIITGIICEILALGYARYSYQPVSYDAEKFNAGQKIHSSLKRQVALIEESRPNGINVLAIMSAVMSAKPAEVTLLSIDISETKSSFTGTAANIDSVNLFCNNIDLTGFKAVVETIKTPNQNQTDGSQQFVISVEPDKAKLSPAGGNKK